MARLVLQLILCLLVIAAVAALALTSWETWWSGSIRIAWGIVVFVEGLLVNLVVFSMLSQEFIDLIDSEETSNDELSRGLRRRLVIGCLAFPVSCLAAVAAALVSGISEQVKEPWQRFGIAALVSIVVLFSPFVAAFLIPGDGRNGVAKRDAYGRFHSNFTNLKKELRRR